MTGYNEQSIKKKCRLKIDELCDSISKEDKDLASELRRHCFVSGGAITSLLQGDEPNDYDIYIDDIDVLEKICNYYTLQWNKLHKRQRTFNVIKHTVEDGSNTDYVEIQVKSVGIAYEEGSEETTEDVDLPPKESVEEFDNVRKNEKKYEIRCITSNAMSLSDDIQIVCRFCGNPEEIFKNYDFAHTKQSYVRNIDELMLNTESLVSIMSKRLIYTGSLFPVCSMFRVRKFIARGWTISSVEILKMAFQISKLDLSDINVLKEQCIGCDYFYMAAFIRELERWRESNPDTELNNEYMFELIEKVYDKDYSLDEK